MGRVTHVIFDLGKVLIDLDHLSFAGKIAKFTPKPVEEIMESFFRSKPMQWFEEGKIEPEAYYGKIKHRLRLKLKYDEFVPFWNEMFTFTPENRQVYGLAKQLSAGYVTAILSNVNVLHLEYLRKQYPVFDAFRHVFASFELGVMKPKPRIYSLALKHMGATAAETFYTDDRPDYVEKARTMGLRAFVYTGPEQLRQDLARCGIELPAAAE
jgi:putative hydrolase of the HAD superfamily